MDEACMQSIVKLVIRELESKGRQPVNSWLLPVGVSARHVHLSREHVEALFGKGYRLRQKKELMGGQYAAEETLIIVGSAMRAIENVRILGPERKQSQVEVARTDAIRLGINPPIRESGFLLGSSPIALVGPRGAVYLDEGCIIAKRHIHMPPDDAESFQVQDGDRVSVQFESERGGVMEDVQIRVDSSFTLEMHIDTDEANGFGIQSDTQGRIV